MKVPHSLLNILNVRKDEWWMVQKLFLLQFFQGAGLSFFFTSAFSRFLEHFPVSQLVWIYLLSAVLLWLAGFFYGKLEHSLSASLLCRIITFFFVFSMVIFWAGMKFIDGNWFYFLMMAWFNVLYLLNNLMFWGIASQLYDVRQSKRLFAIISAGDIPAKFIGYTLALLVVSYTGTANLLLGGLLFILLSFPFLSQILRSSPKEDSHTHAHAKHVPGIHSVVRDFALNALIRRVAALSLIVSATIILVNYGFYAEVKQAYKNDVGLARFIAMFLAIARLVALFIKIIVTSRLVYWLGNRIALLITPLLLVVLIVTLLVTNSITDDSKIVLYIFGLSAIGVDVLRSAIDSPILLTMMQPLPTLVRLRAHNIVKGIMDPFAYLLSGAFLLICFELKLFSLDTLSIALLLLALAWVIGVFSVHYQYLKTLIKTISSQFFSQEEFNLYDPSAREMVEKKINTGNELEVLYILKMLSSHRSPESNRLIMLALRHPSEKVISESLKLISELHIKEADTTLSSFIEGNAPHELRSEAIKVKSRIAYDDANFVSLMDTEDKLIRHAAIVSVINHSKNEFYKNAAEDKIRHMLKSGNDEEKKEAARLLSETSSRDFDVELVQLLTSDDHSVQQLAIKAMGHHPSKICMEQLILKLDGNEKQVVEALVVAREKSLPFMKERILSNQSPEKQKETLVLAIGRIGGRTAHELLLDLIHEQPQLKAFVIKLLHRGRFKAGKEHLKLIEDLTREQLVAAAAILHMQKGIFDEKEKYKELFASLQLELNGIRETLLFLFSFMYDREKISKIKSAIEINKKETNANAIELVDMTVRKDFANPFNAAFEQGDLAYRCNLLKSIFPKNLFPGIEPIISHILSDSRKSFNDWTKVCSLYVSRKYNHQIERGLINKYIQSESQLLREVALYTP